MALTDVQTLAMQTGFAELTRVAKTRGVSDQQIAEWLTSIGVRWLNQHGVSATNIHMWVAQQLQRQSPVPMVGARAANDFGGNRR